jgi:membrane-bound lytic murein transglycosylase F
MKLHINKNCICAHLLIVVTTIILLSCGSQNNELDAIYERGEIRIATKNGPTTYYFDKDEITGMEYQLARRFASYTSLPLKLVIANTNSELIDLLNNDEIDIVAASFTDSEYFNNQVDLGPGYQWITYNIVYRLGSGRPRSLEDIEELHLPDGVLHPEQLQLLQQQYSNINIIEHPDADTQELLEMVQNGDIAYTVANSTELAISKLYFPEIRAAFLTDDNPLPLAWAMKKNDDNSLNDVVESFFAALDKTDTVSSLIDYFYDSSNNFDYVDSRKFINRFYNTLPDYQKYFQTAALENDLDWRLTASLAYQESHWDGKAVSPTGVRGMMMLTQTTAKSVGVENRLDPQQSINGGTKYLKKLINRLPDRIQEPHRTWFALAAYNIGLGHLEDARVITDRQGANPDDWDDVKARLPLLSKKKWYKDTRYGYARGHEPVIFVEKIRRYYSALIHLTQPIQAAEPKLELVDSILINSPVL